MSKRSWWVVLLLFALGFGLMSGVARADALDLVKARGKLVVGIRNDYVPFGFLDGKDQLVGFEVDLAKFVAKDMFGSDTTIEFVPVVASNCSTRAAST